MPKICEFNGMKIYIYFDDPYPPHIHIRGKHKAELYIKTGEYKNGSLPNKQLRNDLLWLNEYQHDIMEAWNTCKAYHYPKKIPPL
ncbi:DUF4160 domain-containing protein [Aquibacillus sediminis]|uniref:DUF4160 domain-containing protein n=1 Tax=Aquibacillus sediminis TaxID=2574734 RepID=UPI001108A2EA|nr:DUF4160 domain-containing protein [Aquibacillus sediminis]